jgi:tetrahydromethanopterin S-methyltransferase subunit G
MDKGMPVYVKIDEYKEVLDVLAVIKNKIEDAKATLNTLASLKEEEDAEIESWKVGLNDVDKKMNYVNQTLFEPEDI